MPNGSVTAPSQGPRRYLITGAAGFIGSHLGEALIARGDEVVGLDDLSTGRESNVSATAAGERYRLVRGSILDEQILDKLAADCDTVIHLAAAVGVKLIIEQPLQSLLTNIRGTERVIEAAHRYGRRVFIASSSEVYGKNGDIPLRETADCVLGTPSRSRWGYALSKAVDESLALAYAREEGMSVVIGRFFNTVGPRQSPAYGMVIPRMIRQALGGDPITVFGDGLQTRCFCHVEDVVRAVIGLLDQAAVEADIFNIGSAEEVSINDLAARIIAVTQSSSTVDHIPYENVYGSGFEDIMRRVPDTRKVQSALGWRPTHDLDSILRAMLEYSAASREPGGAAPAAITEQRAY
jgi:UDP-glucose 4-epimerase